MIDKNLDKKVHKILLDQIGSSMAAREAFIKQAWIGNLRLINRIDFSGAKLEFVTQLIDTALKYGQLEDGEYAVTALIQNARQAVGRNKQNQIDDLIITLQPQLETRSYVPYLPSNKDEASYRVTLDTDISDSNSFYLYSEDEEQHFIPSKIPAIIGRSDSRNPSVVASLGINLDALQNRSRVSRQHARIDIDDDGKYVIETLPNKRPIRVNEEVLKPDRKIILEDGDVIVIGHARLIFKKNSS